MSKAEREAEAKCGSLCLFTLGQIENIYLKIIRVICDAIINIKFEPLMYVQ